MAKYLDMEACVKVTLDGQINSGKKTQKTETEANKNQERVNGTGCNDNSK